MMIVKAVVKPTAHVGRVKEYYEDKTYPKEMGHSSRMNE